MLKNKRKVLILTDHKNHSSENSLYSLAVHLLKHGATERIDIASRHNTENEAFFSLKSSTKLYATTIDESFSFDKQDHPLSKNFSPVNVSEYDLVWLRMPPPLSEKFLDFLDEVFTHSVVINDPKSIHLTGSKEFLTNFASVCPPIKVCRTLEDILAFKQQQDRIVLKPFREYGGKGILKIEGNLVVSNKEQWTFSEFCENYTQNPIDYLAVKYLQNVKLGDKRIIVVKGQILGASLRLPAEDAWLCNVAMGGSSNHASVETEEKEIVKIINPVLSKLGIIMYGIDTLVNDDGKRVLSEINTTSIGGLPQIAAIKKEPLVERAINLIWEYYEEKTGQDE